MFAKLHLLSQDAPEGGGGLRWRAHPYLRVVGAVPKGPAVFEWNARQREDLEALWRDPSAEGARERLAGDLAGFCDKLGWTPDAELLEDAEEHGDEYLLTLSAVPPELYLLPWEVIQVGAAGTYLSDYASAQVRYAMPGLPPRELCGAPPAPGVLFAWSAAGGAVPHEEQAAAIRAAAEAAGVAFRELAEVDEGKLQAALDAGPPSVLHLLCHGLPGPEGEPPRIKWGATDAPSEITATRLARMLRRQRGAIRLVVLSACGSGDGRGDPLFMGSMAQELHKKGIPNVVASRYPLSVPGSRVMTRALYDKLLREAWSLERALRHTRQALFRVDEDGESHPGDAYGIQLYAHDTEQFRSDNDVVAERPVLASYPFGTAARPVPSSGPPAAELALELEPDPALDDEQLADKLRRLSEDGGLTVVAREGRGRALIVYTTVDGAQRLLGAWRSKVLQTALGVIVGGLILTQGILPAFAATSSAAGAVTAAAAAGKATGKTAVAIAGKAIAAKLAVAAVVASVVVGGSEVKEAQTESTVLAPQDRQAEIGPDLPLPPLPAPPPPTPPPPTLPPPALAPPTLAPPTTERALPLPPTPTPAPPTPAPPPRTVQPAQGSGSDRAPDKAPDEPAAPPPPTTVLSSDAERAPPAAPAPEPPKAAPVVYTIPRQLLASLRTEGETEIHPPHAVRDEMLRSRSHKVIAEVKVCLATDGAISSVGLAQSTGYPAYDEVLVGAVRRWRYRPYRVNGTPTAACGFVMFHYEIR
jgi:TonB family protein